MVWIIRWFRPPPHVGGYTVPPDLTARLAATKNAAINPAKTTRKPALDSKNYQANTSSMNTDVNQFFVDRAASKNKFLPLLDEKK